MYQIIQLGFTVVTRVVLKTRVILMTIAMVLATVIKVLATKIFIII
jgi:hypothetical protein